MRVTRQRYEALEPCLMCHFSVGLPNVWAARLLGTQKTWPGKVRRRHGLSVPSRAEANQRTALRAGNANPQCWNRRRVTMSVERAQRIAYEDEQKAVMASERMVCWSKLPVVRYYANHEHTKRVKREYQSRQMRESVIHKLRHVFRRAARRACEAGGKRKEYRSEKYLGCTVAEAKLHIQKQFKRGMHWNNYGTAWHIDHIIPLAKWDLTKEEQRMRAANILNLQPMWARDNMKKSGRLLGHHQMALL